MKKKAYIFLGTLILSAMIVAGMLINRGNINKIQLRSVKYYGEHLAQGSEVETKYINAIYGMTNKKHIGEISKSNLGKDYNNAVKAFSLLVKHYERHQRQMNFVIKKEEYIKAEILSTHSIKSMQYKRFINSDFYCKWQAAGIAKLTILASAYKQVKLSEK